MNIDLARQTDREASQIAETINRVAFLGLTKQDVRDKLMYAMKPEGLWELALNTHTLADTVTLITKISKLPQWKKLLARKFK
jgi:hypothetical protein